MKEKYHVRKLVEFAAANAESTKINSDMAAAITDYNVMMGLLLDPEEDNSDEQSQS